VSFDCIPPHHWSAELESDVRTHRILSPNRRPLLISALLVTLTSVPTMIVVAAGSATLTTAPSVRSPILADPRQGPLVVDSSPRSGLGTSQPPTPAGSPTGPLPPAKSRAATATVRPGSGGSGGGAVVRTVVTSPPAVPAKPASSPEVQAPPPVVAKPSATTPPPAPSPGGSTGVPIQDKAWPGWDRKLKGKAESVRLHRDGHRSLKGSADQSEQFDLTFGGLQS
jgi:hypothetical protein